jgi:hypothetical protein
VGRTLSRAWFNFPYSSGEIAATGGTTPYSYTVPNQASLPQRVTPFTTTGGALGVGGLISASGGDYTFDVRVDDSAGNFVVASFTIPVTDAYQFAGTWRFTTDVTEANGRCQGDDTLPATVRDIEIRAVNFQEISASGFLGVPTHVLTGTLQDGFLAFSGCYPEDGGTTAAIYRLAAPVPFQTLSGTETWDWHDVPNLSCLAATLPTRAAECPDGESTVTAVKLP